MAAAAATVLAVATVAGSFVIALELKPTISAASAIYFGALVFTAIGFAGGFFTRQITPSGGGAAKAWCLVVKLKMSEEAKVAELKRFFGPYAKWIAENEPTTLAYELLVSDKDPLVVTIFERYADKDKAFLEIHRSSDEFKAFRPKLAALEPAIDGHSYYEVEGGGFMVR